MTLKCKRRDGEIVEFKLTKIEEAVTKAFEATKKVYNDEIIRRRDVRYMT